MERNRRGVGAQQSKKNEKLDKERENTYPKWEEDQVTETSKNITTAKYF